MSLQQSKEFSGCLHATRVQKMQAAVLSEFCCNGLVYGGLELDGGLGEGKNSKVYIFQNLLIPSHVRKIKYRKVASSNTSRLEAHAGFFRLFMKRIFDPYVL